MGSFERLSACVWFRASGQKIFQARNFCIPEQSRLRSGQVLQPPGVSWQRSQVIHSFWWSRRVFHHQNEAGRAGAERN